MNLVASSESLLVTIKRIGSNLSSCKLRARSDGGPQDQRIKFHKTNISNFNRYGDTFVCPNEEFSCFQAEHF